MVTYGTTRGGCSGDDELVPFVDCGVDRRWTDVLEGEGSVLEFKVGAGG